MIVTAVALILAAAEPPALAFLAARPATAVEASPLSSSAPPLLDDRFEVLWQIEPSAPRPSEFDAPLGSVIASTRILPAKLIINDDDVYDGEKTLLIPKGSELAFAESRGVAACVINPWLVNKRTRQTFNAMRVNICLLDVDKDGQFEHSFLYKAPLLSLGATGRMRKISPISPVSYRHLSPTLSQDAPSMAAVLTNAATVLACPSWNPSPDGTGFCLDGAIRIPRKQLPFTFSMFGAAFTVHSVEKKNARVTQEAGFAAHPVRMKATFYPR